MKIEFTHKKIILRTNNHLNKQGWKGPQGAKRLQIIDLQPETMSCKADVYWSWKEREKKRVKKSLWIENNRMIKNQETFTKKNYSSLVLSSKDWQTNLVIY